MPSPLFFLVGELFCFLGLALFFLENAPSPVFLVFELNLVSFLGISTKRVSRLRSFLCFQIL